MQCNEQASIESSSTLEFFYFSRSFTLELVQTQPFELSLRFLDRVGYGQQHIKTTTFHVTVGGNSKNTLSDEFLSKSIFERIRGFLKRTRKTFTSTSVKTVPQTLKNV